MSMKNGTQKETQAGQVAPMPQPQTLAQAMAEPSPHWRIVGNCTMCGNPIYAKSSDFWINPNPANFMLSSEPGGYPPPPRRTCLCKPFPPQPGQKTLGGSFRFTFDEETARVLAGGPDTPQDSAAQKEPELPAPILDAPTMETPAILPPPAPPLDMTVPTLDATRKVPVVLPPPPTPNSQVYLDPGPGQRPEWLQSIFDDQTIQTGTVKAVETP